MHEATSTPISATRTQGETSNEKSMEIRINECFRLLPAKLLHSLVSMYIFTTLFRHYVQNTRPLNAGGKLKHIRLWPIGDLDLLVTYGWCSLWFTEVPTVCEMMLEEKLNIAVCSQLELYEIKSFIHQSRAVTVKTWRKICTASTICTKTLPTVDCGRAIYRGSPFLHFHCELFSVSESADLRWSRKRSKIYYMSNSMFYLDVKDGSSGVKVLSKTNRSQTSN